MLIVPALVRLVGTQTSSQSVEEIAINTVANVTTLGITAYLLLSFALVPREQMR